MGRFNKKFILIIMLIGIFLLAGCNKFRFDTFNASKEESSLEISIAPEEKEKSDKNVDETEKVEDVEEVTTNSSEEIITSEDSTPTPATIQPTANIELNVFTVNADTGEIVPATALVPEDSQITPDIIVETVVEAMADQSIIVGIESVDTKDKAVIVSFYKDKAPVAEAYAGYEAAILDAIAQSLIDNMDDYNKVIYRVEGKAYVSSYFELGIDEVYLGDN